MGIMKSLPHRDDTPAIIDYLTDMAIRDAKKRDDFAAQIEDLKKQKAEMLSRTRAQRRREARAAKHS